MTFFVGRCRVTIGFPFLAVTALLLTLDRSGMAAVCLFCAAIHETAHLAAMAATGGIPTEIRFTPFGIDIVKDVNSGRGYRRDIWISLAGPLANLVSAALAFALFRLQFRNFIFASLALSCFNALPVAPLDGGQALYAFLCLRTDPACAEKTVSIVSFLTLAPIAAAGFFILIRSRWNFSLLFVCCYLTALLLLKKDGQF